MTTFAPAPVISAPEGSVRWGNGLSTSITVSKVREKTSGSKAIVSGPGRPLAASIASRSVQPPISVVQPSDGPSAALLTTMRMRPAADAALGTASAKAKSQ